ncbi:MAG TPA: PIN domain-containing protein [Caulobacteraceae bacterium]|nr:PIN domain-containing protein [Caulobacteraceae bacterium]
MILVDTSTWADHLHASDPELEDMLDAGLVLTHPFVIGELALGHLRQRKTFLAQLDQLPRAMMATDAEVLRLIDEGGLVASGIGYVDAHLLAATRLTIGATLLTHDKRLRAAAARLGVEMDEAY